MEKWGSTFWADLLERVGTTLIYGLITMLTADVGGIVSGNTEQWWAVVGLPTALSFLKCLLANLKTSVPTASVINVTSKQATPAEAGLTTLATLGLVLVGSGLLLLVLDIAGELAVPILVSILLIVVGVILVVVDNPRRL